MTNELNDAPMKAALKPIGLLVKIGVGLVVLGFGANLTFAPVEEPLGLAGPLAATMAGVGLSLLLLAAVGRLLTAFRAPSVTPPASEVTPEHLQTEIAESWRRQTVLAFVFSRVATVAAIAAYGPGIAIYFTNFSFGSGGIHFGVAMMFAGFSIGASAVIGDVVALVAAAFAWKLSGSKRWFFATLIFFLLEIVAIAFLWSSM
jgi:hypothetical protein